MRMSPSPMARYEHTNPYVKYRFEAAAGLNRTRSRPLRPPTEGQSRLRSLFLLRCHREASFAVRRPTPPGR